MSRVCGVPGIDPGHGPGDGTIAGATPEHAYCSDMAWLIKDLVNAPAHVLRRPVEDPTNEERAARADGLGCPFVISLHVNDGPPAYHGAHAFHRPGSPVGAAIATAIMQAWPSELSRKSMRARRYNSPDGRLYIEGAVVPMDDGGRERWSRVASVFDAYGDVELVLVEMFYATNPTEDAFAQLELVKEEMALAITRGIVVGQRLAI